MCQLMERLGFPSEYSQLEVGVESCFGHLGDFVELFHLLLALLDQVIQDHCCQNVFERILLCTNHPIPKEACQIPL